MLFFPIVEDPFYLVDWGGLIQLIDKDSGKIVGEMSFIEKSGDQKAMLSDYTGKQIKKVTNLVLALLTAR